jgi:RNA-splicing ligase RtcB
MLDLLWLQHMEDGEVSLDSTWQDFLNESLDEKTIFTYIQGLEEIISNVKPRTMTEKRRMSLAKQHLREVKRYARRMQSENTILQEKLNVLEESKGDK